jgi:hypothetical protein
MPAPSRIPVTLKGGISNVILHRSDGGEFSGVLECSRLAANHVADLYPGIETPPNLDACRHSAHGQIKLAHLTCAAYSYWDFAPQGEGVLASTIAHVQPALGDIARRDCTAWGTHRLVAQGVYVVDERDDGCVLANKEMTKFWRVVGIITPPGKALERAGLTLPVITSLTALPFRGVLAYDGLLGMGHKPEQVTDAAVKAKLRSMYEEALAAGTITLAIDVTGPPTCAGPGKFDMSAMSVPELKQFLQERANP